MKTYLCLVLILCCALIVIGQENPERPGQVDPVPPHHDPVPPHHDPVPPNPHDDTPEKPTDPKPTDSSSSAQQSSSSSSQDDTDFYICTMMAMQCPDGTYASQNAQCEYICGAAPIGHLDMDTVINVANELVDAYDSVVDYVISTLADKDVVLTTAESYSDLCIDAIMLGDDTDFIPTMPAVYNGVRVFYYKERIICSRLPCSDGTVLACGEVCPEDESSAMFWPIFIMFSVIAMSLCCCCLRRRRCKAACNAPKPASAQEPNSTFVPYDSNYPAEQYELLVNQEDAPKEPASEQPEVVSPYMMPMPPMMPMMPPMMPPMPPMYYPGDLGDLIVPPHMMAPNGAYPVMMQAPNGMWYPVHYNPEQ